MPIQQQIEQDYLAAFRAHDQAKVDALRMLKSAMKNEEIKLRVRELDDEQALAVLTRESKRRRESATMYQQGNRPELAAHEEAEFQLITAYLPAQLSDDELTSIVTTTIATQQATKKDFGKVMGAVIAQVKGRADGNRVSAAVKQLLQ